MSDGEPGPPSSTSGPRFSRSATLARLLRARGPEKDGLEPPRALVLGGVGVNRDEEVPGPVHGEPGALVVFHVDIGVPGQVRLDHLPPLKLLVQPPRDREHDVLLMAHRCPGFRDPAPRARGR